jgi:NADH-quinone oxidoreductase subunit G
MALNPVDAAKLGVSERGEVTLTVSGNVQRLTVKLMAELPRGTAGLPAGLQELPGVFLPAWSMLSKVS